MTALIAGCSVHAVPQWGQFHGDPASRGFQQVESGFALSSAWKSKAYEITTSSPVIGKDTEGKETIYIGTTGALLVALSAEDGSEKWRRAFGSLGTPAHLVSSPAVSKMGDIYVVASHRVDHGRLQSTLCKVDPFGNPVWSYSFPDHGFTTGSPKVVQRGDDTLIFTYVYVGPVGDLRGELFVLRDEGYRAELLQRKALGACRDDITGSGSGRDDRLDSLDAVWDFITAFPIERQRDGTLPNQFLDPTVAIVSQGERLLIAIADNLCRLGVYEWQEGQLSVLWGLEHAFEKHSSTALLSSGLMVFGRRDGKVLAHDVDTGAKMWEYDAGQPVMATPAEARARLIFVVSKDNIQVVNAADGTLVHDGTFPRKLKLRGQTFASPAVTTNRVYVPAWEMLTVTHDFRTRSHDTNFHGNGLSSAAIGDDGAVYAVAIDGTVWKYLSTR
ncbi:MAG: PQQ-binding-like beta-propeller repeat protein [Desulfobacterales bacterium]|nr:MAG: PQQ-binding-like beta-propeller repeat protein [Desulfobacterales bacterium]